MPPPKGGPHLSWSWVEGDSPALRWSLADINKGTDASLSGATATIAWFDEESNWGRVALADDTVDTSGNVMSWSPAATDLPAEKGHNGYHVYYGQVTIIFSGGEQRTLPADKSLMQAIVHERNQ